MMRAPMFACLLLLCASGVLAVPSFVEEAAEGVHLVRDDNGEWGGMTNGITHQNSGTYQARKVLDLGEVATEAWQQVREVRLSAYFMVRDYSWHDLPEANGLDESFEVVVNGNVHQYPTNCGAPVLAEGKAPTIAWYDFVLPKEEFIRGPNEIIIRKAMSDKNDDYLYLGIDNSIERGNSSVSFDGTSWTQEQLTVPGGNGEYMVRLYLISKDTSVRAVWRPGQDDPLDDPSDLILYAGSGDAEQMRDGLRLAPGQSARMEWRRGALDLLERVEVTVETEGSVQFAWLDEGGSPLEAAEGSGSFTQSLPANRAQRVSGVQVTAGTPAATIKSIALNAALSYHPLPSMIDMAPVIAPAPPPAPPKPPSCEIKGDAVTLRNGGLQCRFAVSERLHMESLFNEFTKTEMLRVPEKAYLFLVEVDGERYAGSRDFQCAGIEPIENGFTSELTLDRPALRADLAATIDDEGLRLALKVTNTGDEPVHFKVAFPHLAGLAVSEDPADDYYFYPWGGGIIADRPALIRRGYGDHEALYQVMDIFSPDEGGGVYVRADDSEGWHKVLALRKHVRGSGQENAETLYMRVRDEYKWENPLTQDVEGVSVAYEYLRRTRQPGASFAPAPAVLAAHPGDWHIAMEAYSRWAHRVWQFRPWPSRLRSVHNMIAAGWGQGYLFRDGAYRTDIIKPRTDCIELMSWWEWSELGPFSTPMDQLETVMTEAQIKRWASYFVTDPVTGTKMWNNQPGDYKGYNERFGGLPAFRKAVQTYRDMGALVTLYTDPFRLDDACEIGQAHGEEWGVVGTEGEKTKGYQVWNPCHDLLEVREWVAETMGRVMRETGADGIRLDEYGHRGWACYDESHEHTYAEFGVTQWQKAVSEACRLVHEAMDEVRPDLVLTTEHPGYDYMLQFLEGCITYDLTVQASPLRPLEVNTQRFYFPECKAYELDHRSADLRDRRKFWNAVASFGRYYPANIYTILSENEDAYQSGDAYPLLVTPGATQYVYVNRFRGGGKTIYHLYNATGHTFEGTALAVRLLEGDHLFDLLNCQETEPEKRDDGLSYVRVYLPRDEVACLIQLQQRLKVSRNGDVLQVHARLPEGASRLVVADLDGETLLSQAAEEGPNLLDTSNLVGDAGPACVKLLRGRDLLDVAAVPAG